MRFFNVLIAVCLLEIIGLVALIYVVCSQTAGLVIAAMLAVAGIVWFLDAYDTYVPVDPSELE